MLLAVLTGLIAAQVLPVDPGYKKAPLAEQERNRTIGGWNSLFCFATDQANGWMTAFQAWNEHAAGAVSPPRFPRSDEWFVLADEARARLQELSIRPNCSTEYVKKFVACESELCGAPACTDEVGHWMVQAMARDWNAQASASPLRTFPCPLSPEQERAAHMEDEARNQDYKRARWAELCMPAELERRVNKLLKSARKGDADRWREARSRAELVAEVARADLRARKVDEQFDCATVAANAVYAFPCAYPEVPDGEKRPPHWCDHASVGLYLIRQHVGDSGESVPAQPK